jgi:FMN phosphatase YigB (HAD superfamily)
MSDTARDYQTIQVSSSEGMDDLFDVVATVDDTGCWVPVPEASSTLRKSERTIQRYAKSGKLRSRFDNSGRLMIWLATSADAVISPADIVATSADSKIDLATSADTDATTARSSDNDRLWELLKEKDAKIEALLMRNGYLQAQAESAQETIKLLTDSQHKGGWWAKFSSWFFKGK